MQRERDYTTIGIGLLFVAFAVIGNAYPLISVPLLVLAILLMVWGRERRRVEIFIGRLPAGQYLLKGLDQLDLIISPRADFQFRLAVTVKIEELTKNPDGRICIENTSDDPLEYGPWIFSVSFKDDEPKVIHANERVVRSRQVVYYLFDFDEKAMAKGNGSVTITADIDYGSPGTRTRRLHKEIEVEYAVDEYGFIRRWVAMTTKDHEIAISG